MILLDRQTNKVLRSASDAEPAAVTMPTDVSAWLEEGKPDMDKQGGVASGADAATHSDEVSEPRADEELARHRPSPVLNDCHYVRSTGRAPRSVRVPTRRPRSARDVAVLSWTWSPAHSRIDSLYLSLDTARRCWLLWFE